MQAVILNKGEMKINPSFCSTVIRAAYLLADSIRISPFDASAMQYDNLLTEDVSLKVKTECLLQSYKTMEAQKNTYEALLEGKFAYDQVLKMKRKGKDDLVFMKRYEKLVNDVFLKELLIKVELMHHIGYIDLKPMLREDTVDLLEASKPNNGHGIKFETVDEIDLLQLNTPKITDLPIFFLQSAVFNKEDGDFEQTQFLPEESIADISKPWTHQAIHINLMGIQDLSFELLKTLRTQLQIPREQLNTVMDEWINKAMNNNIDFDEAIYFKEKIEPAVAAIDKVIEDSIFLKPYTQQNSSYILKIGAVPVKKLWDYYQRIGFINAAQRTILQLKEQEKIYGGRWPVFILGIGVSDELIPSEINNESAINKRRVISLGED